MTLINYLTRVHFADGVLEDALWSELQRRGKRRPLIVADPSAPGDEVSDRVLAGLPARSEAVFFRGRPGAPTEDAARRFAVLYAETGCDAIIACGGRASIDFAKIARLAVGATRPLAEVVAATQAGPGPGDADAGAGPAPDLYVAPRLSGFATALTAYASLRTSAGARVVLTSRGLIPTVAIFDPTLDLGARADESASAGAEALVACVEPYLSSGYNPPADGIALDGLRRALASLPRVLTGGGIEDRREMAAAGLNGALAQEKGPGAAYALVKALADLSEAAPDSGAVARLVLPGVLRIGGGRRRDARRLAVRDMLALSSKDCLAEGVEAFLKPLPLPRRLSDMGVSPGDLTAAAEAAAADLERLRSPRALGAGELHAVLDAVY